MKKIIYIFALITITFTSCDKNEVNITKNNILTFDSQQKTKKDVEFEKLTIGLSNVTNDDQFLKTLVSTIENDENSNDEEVLLSTFKQKTITDNSDKSRIFDQY